MTSREALPIGIYSKHLSKPMPLPLPKGIIRLYKSGSLDSGHSVVDMEIFFLEQAAFKCSLKKLSEVNMRRGIRRHPGESASKPRV